MSLAEASVPAALDQSVNITDQLWQRPKRVMDLAAENEILHGLVTYLHKSPEELLQKLVDMACVLCHAGSAGVSILEPQPDGTTLFRWVAMGGAYKNYVGGTTPRDDSPCGTCLDFGSTQLYSFPGRVYSSLREADPVLVEGLVVPIPGFEDGSFIGTIWIAAHDEIRKFDLEDVRLMTSLASFTSSAMRMQNMLSTERAARVQADESAMFISSVIESSPDCVKIIDAEGRLLSMNENGCRQMEIADFQTCVMQPWLGLWEGDHQLKAEKAWEVVVAPILNVDGSVQKFLSLSRDVTERRDQQDLVHNALKAEQDKSLVREQFIAVLGHDLRNPLAAVSLGAEIILQTPLNDRATKMAHMIQDSCYRMAGLIENVLDFARGRLGSGIILNRKSHNDLEKTLNQVVTELRVLEPDREIVTHFKLHGPVDCDSKRIAQLFSNLLSNALTYGDPKMPISVGANNNDGFELWVSNAGSKIPEAAMARLFQPFARGEVVPDQQGLGLGLFIATQIAEAHKGTLDVVSSDTETRFTLHLPSTAAKTA